MLEEKNDIFTWIMIVGGLIAAILFVAGAERQSLKFFDECESNNGVVVMSGRGENICIKKTAVIGI